ncbi:MAG: cation:dicarboxylate symporter family transporter, partial [Gemmataceae bacterium]
MDSFFSPNDEERIMHDPRPQGRPLHQKILVGMVLGIVLGLVANFSRESLATALGFDPVRLLLSYVLEPVGKIFLNLLLLTVVPLVFASLSVGVAQLGDLRKLGRMGIKTL